MNAALLLLASTAYGIDVGWQPLPEGGFEFIVQISPEALKTLGEGDTLESAIPPELRGARSYRLVIGDGPLPREGVPPSLEPTETEEAPDAAPPDEPPGEPENDGGDEAIAGGADDDDPGAEGAGDERATLQPPEGADGDARAPGSFEADENSGPLVTQTGYDEESGPQPGDEDSPSDSAATGGEPRKPWVPFSLAMLGLFASVGGNCYLGWLAMGLRARYLAALSALRERRIEVDAD